MTNDELKQIVEALLMSSPEPLSIDSMLMLFDEWEKPSSKQLQNIIDTLIQEYASHAIELVCLATGYCFQTKQQYSPWVTRLFAEKPVRYSTALFEILSIIAYKQPVTRADIEEIRGVTVSVPILKTLLDREWIRVAGYRDVPGKPAVYVTTKVFLDYFNLASLNDLPLLNTVNHE
ncbi:MAG: SMC-Scp complex subunit ScpB [Legionellaceae bacterium]|nr:SMC-Scp complex subunit ScpB [Legionellaceae bacterium]